MKFGLTTERFEHIITVFSLIPAIDEVIIFGSRAMDNYKNNSDIDLAIKGESIKREDVLKLYSALDELPYGYTYDILDYKTITNPALMKHIDTFGINFYKKS